MHRINHAIVIAERVARACIPDLDGRPLYIVQPRAGSAITRHETDCRLGVFFPRLDLLMQPELEAEGKWQGRGVCIAVDAFAAFAMSSDDYDGYRLVCGTVLHELAHWLDRDEIDPPGPQTPAAVRAHFDDAIATRATPPPSVLSRALLAHGESFIRLCAHLQGVKIEQAQIGEFGQEQIVKPLQQSETGREKLQSHRTAIDQARADERLGIERDEIQRARKQLEATLADELSSWSDVMAIFKEGRTHPSAYYARLAEFDIRSKFQTGSEALRDVLGGDAPGIFQPKLEDVKDPEARRFIEEQAAIERMRKTPIVRPPDQPEVNLPPRPKVELPEATTPARKPRNPTPLGQTAEERRRAFDQQAAREQLANMPKVSPAGVRDESPEARQLREIDQAIDGMAATERRQEKTLREILDAVQDKDLPQPAGPAPQANPAYGQSQYPLPENAPRNPRNPAPLGGQLPKPAAPIEDLNKRIKDLLPRATQDPELLNKLNSSNQTVHPDVRARLESAWQESQSRQAEAPAALPPIPAFWPGGVANPEPPVESRKPEPTPAPLAVQPPPKLVQPEPARIRFSAPEPADETPARVADREWNDRKSRKPAAATKPDSQEMPTGPMSKALNPAFKSGALPPKPKPSQGNRLEKMREQAAAAKAQRERDAQERKEHGGITNKEWQDMLDRNNAARAREEAAAMPQASVPAPAPAAFKTPLASATEARNVFPRRAARREGTGPEPPQGPGFIDAIDPMQLAKLGRQRQPDVPQISMPLERAPSMSEDLQKFAEQFAGGSGAQGRQELLLPVLQQIANGMKESIDVNRQMLAGLRGLGGQRSRGSNAGSMQHDFNSHTENA